MVWLIVAVVAVVLYVLVAGKKKPKYSAFVYGVTGKQAEALQKLMAASKKDVPAFPSGKSARVSGEKLQKTDQVRGTQYNKALAGMAFYITYEAEDTRMTDRRISIRGAKIETSDLYIYAYCHERQEVRNFYASRIRELTDVATGDITDKAYDYLSELIKASLSQSPASTTVTRQGTVGALVKQLLPFQAEILALVYMARVDGRLMKAERSCVTKYIVARVPEVTGREAIVDQYVGRLYPQREHFVECFNDVMRCPAEKQSLIYQALEAVMKSEGKADQRGQSMLALYRDILKDKQMPVKQALAS